MIRLLLPFLLVLPFFVSAQDNKENDLPDPTKMTAYEGYYTFYWDEEKGKVWLELDKFDTEFLFVHSLPAGLGSNDIGLDRGQISSGKVVSFRRSGPKVLLVQSNYDYRAISDNPAEQRAVQEAFAESVIWGFELKKLPNGKLLIDLTPLLLSDQHGIVNRLKSTKQGTYSLDANRSAVFPARLRSFPENSEFEASITFTGKPEGNFVRSVTPDAASITLRQHLSFVKLPDPGYQPRMHHPLSGFIYTDFYDYAQPIDQTIQQRYIIRHRLEKMDPSAQMSDPVEPIVYYLDPGTPEPVRSALLEGARWWNEAFEAAGYRNAFRVEMLPEGADPMDVRYNLIQWVHRSTRGWSYGASVVDPRTGEIIKGHVSLGSLRVRQDFLIAQGLIPLFEDGPEPDPVALEMALARLRQLSAHEVGHTIGLTHNFAASMNDRASVMDYPHPYILATEGGTPDFSNAYAIGIGEWDKRAIWFGYQDFSSRTEEEAVLTNYVRETQELGFLFISDMDARPPGGANPDGHLWDNSQQPAEELLRILELRGQRLEQLNHNHLAPDQPAFELERLLTPLYMAHRYQVEAAVKMIGGVSYNYSPWLGTDSASKPVPDSDQQGALEAILQTLHPEHLCIPETVLQQLAPPPHGYSRDREFFPSYTNPIFDPVAAAEASASHTIALLLEPHRLVRVARQHALGQRQESLNSYLEAITMRIFTIEKSSPYEVQVMQSVESLFLEQLFRLGRMKHPDAGMASAIHWQLTRIEAQLQKEVSTDPAAHDHWLIDRIRQYRTMPDTFEPLPKPKVPPGSPIGCGE